LLEVTTERVSVIPDSIDEPEQNVSGERGIGDPTELVRERESVVRMPLFSDTHNFDKTCRDGQTSSQGVRDRDRVRQDRE